MNKFRKRTVLGAVFFVFLSVSLQAEKTPVENLYQYKLSNGLTLFAAENHSVPLVYIEIAVRAGAVTQTAENCGLFHLYEHMMFKGNDLYPDSAAMDRADSDMGVSGRNGSTSVDCVNYFFTVPKDQLEKGLAYWNAAVRTPKMDPVEFENEKKVVIAEISGYLSKPGYIYQSMAIKTMFPGEPWRVDAGGSLSIIQNATVEQLRAIQKKYYIPCNTALFVGGDINPDEVYALVKKIYGSWSNNGNKAPEKRAQMNTAPLASTTYLVMPYDQMSTDAAQILISFRGPDADYNSKDTYIADLLGDFMSEPDGLFKKTLADNKQLGIPSTDYVQGGYTTKRANGTFDFSAFVVSPDQYLIERTQFIVNEIQNKIIPQLVSDSTLYGKTKMAYIVKGIRDDRVYTEETPQNLLSNVRFWWTCTGADYYFTYSDTIAKVTQKDAASFADRYFTGKSALVTVFINPKVYEPIKNRFAAAGYTEITSGEAFWWNSSASDNGAKK